MKKYGDKVGMGVCSRTTTICPMQHAQATPAYISLHVVYNLYWTSLNQSECIRNAKLKHSYPNGQFLQTPHVGICMQVWLVEVAWDIWWSFLNTLPSLPCPHIFSPVHPCILFNFFKIFSSYYRSQCRIFLEHNAMDGGWTREKYGLVQHYRGNSAHACWLPQNLGKS